MDEVAINQTYGNPACDAFKSNDPSVRNMADLLLLASVFIN